MDCKYRKYIKKLLDSRLSEKKQMELNKHAEQCSECSDSLKEIEQIDSLIKKELLKYPYKSKKEFIMRKIEEKKCRNSILSAAYRFRKYAYGIAAVCALIFLTVFAYPHLHSNNPAKPVNKQGFEIYLAKDLSSSDAEKTDINKIPLEDKPIITEKDISDYYWKSSIFKIHSSELYNKIEKSTKLSGTPFILVANGERIYLGTLWTLLSSMCPPEKEPVLLIQSSSETIDKLKKDGYNIDTKDSEYYFEIFSPHEGKDTRNDIRIYNALKNSGILRE